MKVLTVLGTRPEIIRLSEIIKKLDGSFEHILVHTGQNYDYELNQVFFDDLGVRKPDYFLKAAGVSPVETVGNVLKEIENVIVEELPDAFLVLGDTNSCLAAYAAKRHKVPVFHLEAGNRCFDARVPEELNRKIIDHISDVNLTYSQEALTNLFHEGLPADRNFFMGSPLHEVFTAHKNAITASDIMDRLGMSSGKFFLASIHREENVNNEKRLKQLIGSLEKLAEVYGLPVVMSTHPRTKKNIEERSLQVPDSLLLHAPFGFHDYNALQLNAKCVISDSGSINEESAILGFKAVNVRYAHERPEASVCRVTPMTTGGSEHMLSCVKSVLDSTSDPQMPHGYAVPDVSLRVVNHILSLTDYVRRQNFWVEQ